MSSASRSPLEKSTDTINNDSHTTSKGEGGTDWESAMEIVAKLVSKFFASRVDTTPSGRADVVFESLSVEGSGKGVRRFIRTLGERPEH